jgi:hypothetical protein
MSRPRPPYYPSLVHVAIGIVLTVSFSACSKGASQPSGAPASGKGGITFRLAWQRPPLSKAQSQFSPSFNACVDHAIDTITAAVYDAADNNRFVASDSWPCSTHEGLLFGIPAGMNYAVQVEGRSLGSMIWSGQTSSIVVTSDQTTDAGTIVMGYIGGDTTNPTVASIDPVSDAVNVPVTARLVITFSEPMAISTISATNILLMTGGSSTVPGNVSYNAASNAATVAPVTTLAYNTQHVLHVLTGVTDIAGNQLVSAYTNTFTTEPEPLAAPGVPSGVTAVPGNGQVTLDWSAANGAASYNIYYGLSPGVTPSSIADARAPFVHMDLTNGQAYYYLVEAVNSHGTATAAEVTATPMADTLASGLAAYYPFSGDATDASGHGHDGTVSGATLTTDRFGFGNNAYGFDGSSEIILGSLPAIDDHSVSLWFKKSVASSYPSTGEADLFGTQAAAWPSSSFKFGFNSANPDQISIAIATTSLDYLASCTVSSITDTHWHHLVITRSTVSVQAYLDDVQQTLTITSSAGTPSGTITSGTITKLGTVGGMVDTKFDGSLDDVRIYSRVLSAGEIARLYSAGNPNVPSAPASLTAVPGNGQNVITWSAVTGAISYNLYWSTTPIAPDKTAADIVILNVTSPYTHTGLTNGQTYYYMVTAADSYGESTGSIQVAATPN